MFATFVITNEHVSKVKSVIRSILTVHASAVGMEYDVWMRPSDGLSVMLCVASEHTHTHTHLTASFPGQPG